MGQGYAKNLHFCRTLGREWRTAFAFSPMPKGSLSVEAEGAKQLLSYFKGSLEPDILFGHSTGAVLALSLARFLPSVQKLVLLAPAPMPGMIIPAYLQARMLLNPLQYLLPSLLGKEFSLTRADTCGLMLNMMKSWDQNESLPFCGKPWSGAIVREMMLSPFSSSFDWAGLEGKEIHVISGGANKMIQPWFAKKVGQHIADQAGVTVHYREIPNADHTLMCGDNASFAFHCIFQRIDVRPPYRDEIDLACDMSYC